MSEARLNLRTRSTCLNRGVLFVVCLLVFLVKPLASDDTWYAAWEQAMQAIKSKNWELAEQYLLVAKNKGPKPGKNVRKYGAYFIKPYVPDYYLALVYYNLNRDKESFELLQRVESSGLISQKDPQFTELIQMKQSLNDRLKPKGGPVEIVQGAKEIQETKSAINEGRVEDARKSLQSAKQKAPSNPEIPKLAAQIAALENRREAEKAEKQQLAKAEIETAKVSAVISSATALIEKGRLEDAKKQLDPFKGTSDERVTASYARIARIENDFRTLVRDSTTWTEVQNARRTVLASSSRDASNKLYRQLLDELSQKEKTIQDQFALTLRQADSALAAAQYAEARSLANRAARMDVDDRKVNELLTRIDLGENVRALEKAIKSRDAKEAERLYSIVAKLSPQDSRLSLFNKQVKNLLQPVGTPEKTVIPIDPLERSGIIAFYSGDYPKSIEDLQNVTARKRDSARAYFYLGCSTAAIALMKLKNEDAGMLQRAREYFAQVRKIKPGFTHNRKFISPRIMQIYDANK